MPERHECGSLSFGLRWFLVNFKREFDNSEVCRLWEAMWTRYLTPHFTIYIALVLLRAARPVLMRPQAVSDATDILGAVNALAFQFDIVAVMRTAEELYWRTEVLSDR